MSTATTAISTLVVSLGLLAADLDAQATTTVMKIGGAGAMGSEGGDPPLLNDGRIAHGEITYTYDASIGQLIIEVANHTTPIPGEYHPVINEVYFNIPHLADIDLTLVDQSAAQGPDPYFELAFDAVNPPPVNGWTILGAYSASLRIDGVQGGIAHPDATEFSEPIETICMGPARFVFDVTGSDAGNFTSDSFAYSPARLPPGIRSATAMFKFRSGGGAGYGWIGTRTGCIAGLWHVGTPCPGETFEIVMGTQVGCAACLLYSFDDTPMDLGWLVIPISPPWFSRFGGFTDEEVMALPVTVPDNPDLVGMEVHFTLATSDEIVGIFFSPVVTIPIVEAP